MNDKLVIQTKVLSFQMLEVDMCSGYIAQLHSTKPELNLTKSCSNSARSVLYIRDDDDLKMVPTGNKAKRLSLVTHNTKTIHHHYHRHVLKQRL